MICDRPGCGTVFCDDTDQPPGTRRVPKRYCSRECMRRHHVERRTGVSLIGAPLCRLRNKGTYPDELTAAADGEVKSPAYGVPLWPYQCDECGDWHLTSHPKPEPPVTGDSLPVLVRELARKLNTRP